MPNKVAFISSTFTDLVKHRRAVWEVLQDFDVAVRGMEEFGARTEKPLETCLAEVEQSDVYVGIVAFRIGSIDPASNKSFTQLEYERAVELHKEVLIYLADEENAPFPFRQIDQDAQDRARLVAFKDRLREQHTVDTFVDPEDLAAKLKRDFSRHFESRKPEEALDEEREFEQSERLLGEFQLTPRRVNGKEIRLIVDFDSRPFPASRAICDAFNLEYGNTIGCNVTIKRPGDFAGRYDLDALFAAGTRADELLALNAKGTADVYAILRFTLDVVRNDKATFRYSPPYKPVAWPITTSVFLGPAVDNAPATDPPEGRRILVFSKSAQ